ncbi:MAG: GIN domain-containing protein [Lepagella sp.]
MKKVCAILACVAAVSFATSARQYLYEVGPFDKISQRGSLNIVYRACADSVGMVVYDSDVDFSEAIEVSNNKGSLMIKEVVEHGMGTVPTIYIYSDYITQIKNEGEGTIYADMPASVPTFSASLLGNGKIVCNDINTSLLKASVTAGNGIIVLRGTCKNASYRLASAGVIQADELKANTVKCNVAGTGSIGCYPLTSLDVRGIGTTKVYYVGNPTIKKVGGCKILPINEMDITTEDQPASRRVESASDNHEAEETPAEEEEAEEAEETSETSLPERVSNF